MRVFGIALILLFVACEAKPPSKENSINKDSIKISCNCSTERSVEIDDYGDTIFTKLYTDASFPYGSDSLNRFFEKNINAKIPLQKSAPSGRYTVVVMFVVDKKGNLSRFIALTKNGYGMEEEVLRVYKRINKFKPGILNGKNVSSYRKAPYTFKIS